MARGMTASGAVAVELPASARPRPVLASLASAAVLVSALGYFVDLYDLILFSAVRVASLSDLGVPADAQVPMGVFLLNLQNVGLLVGGVLWGVLADKRGRVRVLFASIALYSVANLANAFVTNTTQYAVLRLLAGIGLAGELGVAITLVTEVLPAGARAWGAVLIATVGTLGGLAAGVVSQLVSWRVAYAIGGTLGLALLVMRVRLAESGIYASLESKEGVRKGDLRLLFGNGRRAWKYACCVLVGIPNWYFGGIALTFGPEILRDLGVAGTFNVGAAVVAAYLGLGAGAIVGGALATRFATRKWVIYGGICLACVPMLAFGLGSALPLRAFYVLMFVSTFATSYVYLSILLAAEQFGTNLRGTVATSVPNVVRASVIPMTIAFALLAGTMGQARAALWIGVVVMLVALLALRGLEETHGKALDFVET